MIERLMKLYDEIERGVTKVEHDDDLKIEMYSQLVFADCELGSCEKMAVIEILNKYGR